MERFNALTDHGVQDGSVTWANGAGQGTIQDVALDIPGRVNGGSEYHIFVHNPSTATALTLKIQTMETMGGEDAYADIATIAVPANGTKSAKVSGFGKGDGGRFRFTNDTAVGASGAFTAAFRVRKV